MPSLGNTGEYLRNNTILRLLLIKSHTPSELGTTVNRTTGNKTMLAAHSKRNNLEKVVRGAQWH